LYKRGDKAERTDFYRMETELTNSKQKKPTTFGDHMRIWFKGTLDPIGTFLNRLGLRPNTVTFIGLVGNTLGAYLLAIGQIQWGGVLILAMGPVDALDGTMARLRGESSRFGAFVDSVTDRYSELVIFGGLLFHYIQIQDGMGCALTYLSAAGSVLVSYVKARAEGVGFEAKVGVLTRLERFLVLIPGLLFNRPEIALWIIAILGNGTAVQRIWHVRTQAFKNNKYI
jgi:CDP-diacylglycerol--glycerol-3-phosphate 3-phosphatidyltransferase